MDITTLDYATQQDSSDPLHHLRDLFTIPTKADLSRKTLQQDSNPSDQTQQSTYLCGNSLGLQPASTGAYFQQYLSTWASKGVYGHFKPISDSNLAPWMNVDDDVTEDMAKLVGAKGSEVAVMQTLTTNLHLMMLSFFRPTEERWKIILEGKAFPSDHYAVESQLHHHNLSPSDAMILIEPPSTDTLILPTEHILSIIDAHASETALLLLPGIQFYTGQLFDIPCITAHAHSKGIVVGWDLAHAVGNVPLRMHDWNVDFAVWCTYKYMNCGPGSIGGCFVHERHSQVTSSDGTTPEYRPRMAGWWGSSKSSRFAMTNHFEPIPGAAGFQISNPSVADLTAVRASLDVFKQTSMEELRKKSLGLTKYLEDLLAHLASEQQRSFGTCFSIITPTDPAQRGAQLSVLLKPGLLDSVMETLEEEGVVVDERRPDVIRVAPAPLYNTFTDVFNFINVFRRACEKAVSSKDSGGESTIADAGKENKGWSEVK
ncbi:Kynureninase (L-kynurenine hydrolase) [Saxophila tyrrhenica]|uniref:Kynureninase n=1 Tax=Saxophila tyrrhenica TaxID=1690608 RepID=A0AAV9P9R5_9PEZI|nr:Kynureninase (L-kynurenine hydrolase) [Saxophila tyrrhenica]